MKSFCADFDPSASLSSLNLSRPRPTREETNQETYLYRWSLYDLAIKSQEIHAHQFGTNKTYQEDILIPVQYFK